MAQPATDNPAWWTDVSTDYGDLVALGDNHPGSGLLNALQGKYHADDGNTHGGLSDWVHDHPPGPEPKGV